MKRYLYILLVAVWAVVACEPINFFPTPTVEACFGEIIVKAEDKSAVVRVADTYLTVDGERYDDVNVWVEYTLAAQSDAISVAEYTVQEGALSFVLDELTPSTDYVAYVVVDGGKYGKHTSDRIPFATNEEYIPFSGMNYKAVAEAKGIVAELSLSNLQFIYEDEAQKISTVMVEYLLQNSNKRVAKEFAGSLLADNSLSVKLPFEGEEYLTENRNYTVYVTLTAEGVSESFSAQVCEFKTSYAEITASIATPELSYDADNGISATVDNVEVFYDGISDKVYKSRYTAYYAFYYREADASTWAKIDVERVDDTISTTIISALVKKGATYQLKAALTAGVNNTPCESEVVEITIPEDVVVPTPPVEGGGDTSSIAGTWHLTEWRGAVPSFEVYLDITEEGVVTLWQKIEHRAWECFFSSADIENGIISGVYSDGVMWGASYYVSVAENSMTWVDVNDATDISVYTRSELPEGLTEVVTRSMTNNIRFL